MADPRLKLPLDPAATNAANQKLWAAHPELGGQPLTSSSDPALKSEWTNDYVAAGGAKEPEKSEPPSQTTQPCPLAKKFDCAAAWKDCESQADAIINKSSDPITRNKNINAAYAKLYLQDPKMEWLGAAAFASKQVGCGMKDAKFYMDMAEADRNNIYSETGPNPIVQMQGGYAEPVYKALVNGNKAVFKDIYPPHLFYQKYGLAKLKQCADARQPPLDKKVVDGFSDIDAGHSSTGAIKILQHEQLDILQSRDVFGNQEMIDIMKFNQSMSQHWYGRLGGAQATSVSFTSNCTGDPSVTFQGNNPADPNERWPYAQNVVNTFDQIKGDPSTIQNLQNISNGAP